MATDKRFVTVYKQREGLSGTAVRILVDKETGVNYLFARESYGAGLTPLLDGEGKPVVTAPLHEDERR